MNLDAVYSISGQKVGAIGLSSLYIVKISKGEKTSTLKIVM